MLRSFVPLSDIQSGSLMRILGLETTCDETSAAIVELRPDGTRTILSNRIRSQDEAHRPFGGVVPEIAARAHVEVLDGMIREAMAEAGLGFEALDGIAAAAGPGLIGGVLVGLTTAKAIALGLGKPLLAINHLEAHALTPRLMEDVRFPYLLLLASGGHTQLVAVQDVGKYTRIGTTIDDAIGEAFDKVAKMLSLGFPGGPAVEQAARDGDAERFALPRPLFGKPDPDFSLSGLKTAVRLAAEAIQPLSEQDVADLCASFQAAIVDCVIDRTRIGIRVFRREIGTPSALVIAGGVGANRAIRQALQRAATEAGLRLVVPPPLLCTDNGAMIAWAGIERLRRGMSDSFEVAARPRWPLDEARAKPGARA
jgi:N6-L-threonylcarbamoyladenine synthase